MAERKDRMALLSRYSKLHTAKYEHKPSLNLNVEQWAADSLVESYGIGVCYDLLDYYFNISMFVSVSLLFIYRADSKYVLPVTNITNSSRFFVV